MSTEPATAAPSRFTLWKRRLVRLVLVYAVVPYVVLVLIFGSLQRSFIFQPTKTERLLAKSVGTTQSIEDVDIESANHPTLHGWRFRATTEADRTYLVLYFPGNAGCRSDRVADCREFALLGFDVLLFDYPGYGDNPGSPTEKHLADSADRIWSFATTELNTPPNRIVIFGESMGGAVATRLAAETCSNGTPPAALMLNSTFASLSETVAWHYPMFPFQYLLLDRFPSVQRIPSVTCPILQFHGTADDIVPFSQGRRLFQAAADRSANGVEKQFVTIEGGQHNFITLANMRTAVTQLMKRLGDD